MKLSILRTRASFHEDVSTCSAVVLCYMESREERSSWGLPSEFSVSPSEMACMGAENSLPRML